GKQEEADQTFQKAIASLEQVPTDDPEARKYRQALFESQINRGSLAMLNKRPKEAVAAFEKALALAQELAKEGNHEGQLTLANAFYSVAGPLALTGKLSDAAQNLRSALEILDRLATRAPSDPDLREQIARASHQMALILVATRPPHF